MSVGTAGGTIPSWILLPGMARGERLRRILSDALVRDTTFDIAARDNLFDAVMSGVGREVNFIVTGHSRLERAIKVVDGRQYYYNTGTWSR